ncbi:fatty acid synthase alpha subunit Lsd1, partial [Coemansia furcata]
MFIVVTNAPNHFLVAGHINSAVGFVQLLSTESADLDEDQSRIPFPMRKPVINAQYTTISAPYHCPLLEPLVDKVYEVAVGKGWVLSSSDLQIEVRATDDGHDIRIEEDLTMLLLRCMLVLPVNWPLITQYPGITHIVDFGPGGLSGFGMLAYRNIEGLGIPIICAGVLVSSSFKAYLGTKSELYKTDLANVVTVPNWLAEFGPKLVRTTHDNQLHIDTPMSRVLGAPTVMVAGMTPTTVNENYVAAINNAGYHVELAGGGIFTEGEMERKVDNLVKLVKPGQGITLNCIYVNQRQWSFQFPALLRMRAKGVPISGLCIGGGVPSLDSATTIIDSLRSAGIRHVAFKPSTAEVIRHVVSIAKAHSAFSIVLQWTGGRAGGHHSFEDFHQPILETYAAVRACRNIVLVAGSGFGDADGSLPYLTGDWSVALGRAPMPFDGILLGSRVMVAKEAGTSLAAKELIVATPGLTDSEWHKTYDGPSSGVMTITSEYGELNHALSTRAMVLATELRNSILSQPREKHTALLLARKDEIISRLNSDYLRPWFGRKASGLAVDLEDMTYAEVICRLVELMYVKHQQRWIHDSYRRLVLDFISRAECRLGTDLPEMSIIPDLRDVPPTELAQYFTETYLAAESQLLHSEDIQFFVSICKRRGQKPVPFITVLDSDFSASFMKDTIWQSEDLDSVVDQDPQRIGIQQGPVAARYSTIVNEPVKDILDGVYHGHIAALLNRDYNGDAASVPLVEYISAQPGAVVLPASVDVQVTDMARTYKLPSELDQLPDLDVWLNALAGSTNSWLRALLTTRVIVEGSSYVDNYVQRVLRPHLSQIATVYMDNGKPQSLAITGCHGDVHLLVECLDKSIDLKIFQPTSTGIATLQYLFVYQPVQPLTPISLVTAGHGDRIRRLYSETWIDNSDEPTEFEDHVDPDAQLLGGSFTITQDHVYSQCQVVGNSSQHYLHVADNMRVVEIINMAAGKRVTIVGSISRSGQVIAHIETAFLSCNFSVSVDKAFQRMSQQRFIIQLATAEDVAVLEAKEWFVYCEDSLARVSPGSRVEFHLDTDYRFLSENVYSSTSTTGRAFILAPSGRLVHIANIDFECGVSVKNPVIEYLRRHEAASNSLMFDDNGYSLVSPSNQELMHATVPDSNLEYAKVSADGNPVHVNPYVADIAGLPGTITHGLWTSASTRALVECYAANDKPERIRVYQTNFVGMVLPGDELRTELFHVGMKCGRMLIKGITSK